MPRSVYALVAVLLLAVTSSAKGDGLIIIRDPPTRVPGHFAFAPLEVAYHNVTVTIDRGVAVTAVDQEFYNPNGQRLEGTYVFPLPDGATVDKFAMDIDGQSVQAELLSADKARALYEDVVRRQKDPALLEYAGRGAFKVRVFPIEPNGRKHVKLQYTQVLKSDAGLTEYVYPLNTEKFSARPLGKVSVKVDLTTATPIKNVYCPSHPVDVRRDGASHAVVGFEDRDARPDTDFKLVWSADTDPVGISLVSWQTGADDGYFLLMASPGVDVDAHRVQPRDVCFVLDTSGSMAGAKLDQAKKALQFCLANLSGDDRFEVVRFSTESEGLFGELRAANGDNVARATAFARDLKPTGGTAIADALGRAAGVFGGDRGGRPGTVIFLTDGQPTVGETSEDKLVEASATRAGVRTFCFGIGTDINTHLLDRIADRTHAASQYVLPEEDIEVKVSAFFAKVRSPVLSGLAVTFGDDVHVSQMYPHDLPDLFKGETLTVFGRYRGAGPATATVAGSVNGERRSFAAPVTFAKEDVSRGYVPRLWATRRVGWLLDEVRLHGQSTELVDEIVKLARAHGIVTPYTSYLILEDERRRNVPVARQTMRELGDDRQAAGAAKATYDSARRDSATLEKDGRRAVTNSANAFSLANAESVQQAQQGYALDKAAQAAAPASVAAGGGGFAHAGPTTSPSAGYRVARNYAQQSRVVNGRAFYQNGSVWTDAHAQDAGLKQQAVAFDTDAYYDLMAKHPDAAAWLALGDDVDVVLDGTVYSVRNNAAQP